MSMLDLLAGLARANLAAGVAIVVVALLRGPVRRAFGARAAYVLWLAPLLMAVATLAPNAPAATSVSPVVLAAGSAAAGAIRAGLTAGPSLPPVLLGLWLAGIAVAAALLLRRQARFLDAMRRREAGPAVVGAFRPRIVTPADFDTRFDAAEREVILAHEAAHLAGGDARINAFAALVQCLCWFNPLVHLGAHLMRIDQELACDATVVTARPAMRRLYAEVLLKTQIAGQPLPLGCYWPAGSEHPLKTRIVMLQKAPPLPARRVAGAALAAVASLTGACAAWAARPDTPALITAPDWVARPAAEDLAPLYPPAAKAQGLPGTALITCRVDRSGKLNQCALLREAPAGAGFGSAALALADRFQMKPQTKDGAPTDGGVVRIPFRFALPTAPAQ